jgi:hypothetical protein
LKKKKGTVTLTVEEYNQIFDTIKKYFALDDQLHRAYEDKIQILKRALRIA